MDFMSLLDKYKVQEDGLPYGEVRDGHLLYLYFTSKGGNKKPSFYTAALRLQEGYPPFQVDKDKVRLYIRRMVDRVQLLRKTLNQRHWDKLQERAQNVYKIPFVNCARPVADLSANLHTPIPPAPSTPPAPSIPSTPPAPSTPQRPNPPIPAPLTPRRARPIFPSTPRAALRRDCLMCTSRRTAIRALTEELRGRKDMVREAKIMKDDNRKLRQKVLRKETIINRLRLEKGSLQRRLSRMQTPESVAREIRTLKVKIGMRNKRLEQLSSIVRDLEVQIVGLHKELKALEAVNDYLVGAADTCEDTDATERNEDHMRQPYDVSIRKCIYRAILSQVPVAQAGDLVRYVSSELGDAPGASRAPSKSSVSRMAHEISVLSLIQAGDMLMTCGNTTLGWDATSISTSHLNELHVSSNDRTLTLSVARLPGGRAIDYANHVTAALDDVASCYSEYKGVDAISFKAEVIRKMSSTLSDRAPVNHCVVELLKVQLDADHIIELNCNLHPLDGFASQTRSALMKLDKEMGLTCGRDGAAAAFIYNLSKLRYKQSGDPGGFKLFLNRSGIPVGMFPRYVGNRLHILFRTSGSIIRYLPQLKEYLEKYCRCDWARKALASSLGDDRLTTQFRALGFCGKVITGPWMTLFYRNPQGLSNVEMVPFLKSAESRVAEFLASPGLLVSATTDVFGTVLPNDMVLQSLRESGSVTSLLMTYLKTVLNAISRVFDRQLVRYCHGPLSNLPGEVLNSLSSASPNNIWAERSLGMADALMRRAPMATLGFIDAKVKAKTNKTLEWLGDQDKEEQEKLVLFARRKGAILRRQRVAQGAEINNTLRVRMDDVARARDNQKRKVTGKTVKKAVQDGDTTAFIFDSLDGIQRHFVKRVIDKDRTLVGTLFQHTWYDAEKMCDVVYWGRIQEESAEKVTVAYWVDGQLEDASEDWDVKKVDILTDMVLHDLYIF